MIDWCKRFMNVNSVYDLFESWKDGELFYTLANEILFRIDNESSLDLSKIPGLSPSERMSHGFRKIYQKLKLSLTVKLKNQLPFLTKDLLILKLYN